MTQTTFEQAAWEEGHESYQAHSSAVRLPFRKPEQKQSYSHQIRVQSPDDGKRDIAAVVYRRKSHLRKMLERSNSDRLRIIMRAEEDLRYLLT